jgi:chromosome segregation ATPase
MNDIKSSITNLDAKVDKKFDDVNKKIDSKFDRLMYLIIGSVVLKGGFDFWQEERRERRRNFTK